MTEIDQLKHLLAAATPEQRREIFNELRREFPIHAIEAKLDTQAEIILEAIDRASDLTLRGIRGVIAEAAFVTDVVSGLTEWESKSLPGDAPYDFLLADTQGDVKVQVKLQRQKQHRPMLSEEAPRHAMLPRNCFVVETQRTRTGTTSTGERTRPYRFGEFDILAVSMHPSARDWSSFMFTVAAWLLPSPAHPTCIQTYQAVPREPNEFWTSSFREVAQWLRKGEKRPHPILNERDLR